MSMQAFLTGSHAYGTPTEKSDIDLVVMVDLDELEKLKVIANPKEEKSLVEYGFDGSTSISLRFGKLNLIACVTPEVYDIWRQGTDELIALKPVTRDEAVSVFTRLRCESGLEPASTKEEAA